MLTKNQWWNYAFVSPMLILFLLFTVWPIVGSWYFSFFDWDGYRPLTDFVGWDNFVEVAEDPMFWHAFVTTFIFAFAHIFIELPLALLAAVLLNHALLKGRHVYRLLFFLPVVTTTVVIGVVFAVLLNPLDGPVNVLGLDLGVFTGPVNFLGSPSLALPTVIAVSIWKNIGNTLIYWMAGLQTIPRELYEAARIDGASATQQFIRITVPMLVPIGVVIMLLTFIHSLHPFDLVQAMTEGGPNFATDVIPTYIYRYAFDPEQYLPRYGFASAAGIMFGVAVMVVTAIQALLLRKIRPAKGR